MAKITAAERREREAAERNAQQVRDYIIRHAREAEKPVVRTSNEAFGLAGAVNSPLFGREREVTALWRALSDLESAREDLGKQIDWLRRSLDDAERSLAANHSTNSCGIVQSRGNAVDVANATWHANAKAVASIAYILGVRCSVLYSEIENAAHERWLRTTVVPTPDGRFAVVENTPDGPVVPAAIAAAGGGTYDTREQAWTAHAAVCGKDLRW